MSASRQSICVRSEKTIGLVLKPPMVRGIYRPLCADPPVFRPDRFQRYILGVIDEMVSIHNDTWSFPPRQVLMGDWLYHRMRATFSSPRPADVLKVMHERSGDRFPLTAALSESGDYPEPRRVETETVTEHLPRLRGLIVRRAVGHDEYHIDVQ